MDLHRDLVGRQPGAQEGLQFADVDILCTLDGFDHGDRYVSEPLVGTAEDRRIENRRVGPQCVADGFGLDFETTTDDRVVGPAVDVEETILVEMREIAGAHPVADTRAGLR